EHGARGVPPFALHGTLCLAALLVLAACGPSQPSSPTRTSAPARRPSRISQEPLSPLLRCPPVPTFSPLISEILLTQAHLPHPLRTTNCSAAGRAHSKERHLSSRSFSRANWEAGSLFNIVGRSSLIR